MTDWTPKGLDRVRIAERAKRSVWSVDRTYKGKGNAFTRAAVAEAAAELGYPLPPVTQPKAA
jgi:hypothetical protein